MQIVNPVKPVQSIAYVVIAVLAAITLSAEPLASALVQLFVAFGVALSQEQQDALITVVRIVAQILVSAGVVQFAAKQQEKNVTPMAAPVLPAGSVVTVEGSEDQVEIQPTPPGPVAIEGGSG
jgi:hypothetical protein